MGNTSCRNLNMLDNACDLYHCKTLTIGLPSGSASRSDQWLVELVNGTEYDGHIIDRAFVKLWAEYTSLIASFGSYQEVNRATGGDYLQISLGSLEYEAKIYMQIIKS